MKRFVSVAAFGLMLAPAVATAEVSGAVTTDLNLRGGPGSGFPVIATMPAGSSVTIDGCVEAGNWCFVQYGGNSGYAFSQYLTTERAGTTVVIAEEPSLVETVVGTPIEAATEATGAVVGALGAAVSGVADAITPDREVVTYVERNPVDPVYLDGEVVVGANVPADVTFREVPQSQYVYTNINGEPVLVDPQTRRVVYVYR